MAQHGGARPGAGRKTGAVSKAKRELADMAQDHAAMALQTLADIAQTGESEAARVSAANAILDRAYGKPPQSLEHKGSLDVTMQTKEQRDAAVAAAARADS